MATPLRPIECSAQPLSISFSHRRTNDDRPIVAAGLIDGTVEIHDLTMARRTRRRTAKMTDDDDEDDEEDEEDDDTILASVYVARGALSSSSTLNNADATRGTSSPSCRCVLFSRSDDLGVDDRGSTTTGGGGGDDLLLYTACNAGSIRCLDVNMACDITKQIMENANSPILWSIENAHNVGINRMIQLPHRGPCRSALVTGDDGGTVRLWDARMCGGNGGGNNVGGGRRNGVNDNDNNPFDGLMTPPNGCVQQWKVNRDYISDLISDDDGNTIFATSGDGTLSVFDVRYVVRGGGGGTSRSVIAQFENDDEKRRSNNNDKTWETSGYAKSDEMEDELLSVVMMKNSQKLLVGTQDGTLCLYSYGKWEDMSDRYPGHPNSIDALLKVDEDTVLTGSSDGLIRAVQLLPNALLGVLGSHDGFPVEGLGWSAGREMVGSISHDEYIRLWDASLLNGDDDDDDDDGGKEGNDDDGNYNTIKEGGTTTKAKGAGEDSEDDWEDMDEDEVGGTEGDDDDDDSDDDDSDDDAGGGSGKPKKREKIFKTENESFFSDL